MDRCMVLGPAVIMQLCYPNNIIPPLNFFYYQCLLPYTRL